MGQDFFGVNVEFASLPGPAGILDSSWSCLPGPISASDMLEPQCWHVVPLHGDVWEFRNLNCWRVFEFWSVHWEVAWWTGAVLWVLASFATFCVQYENSLGILVPSCSTW